MQYIKIRGCALIGTLATCLLLSACFRPNLPILPASEKYGSRTTDSAEYQYLIGPGDDLQIFVWRNPEVSQNVNVRPDGMITTPLVEDLQASGKTPTELARDIEKVLETYIRQPIVTVIYESGIGPFREQIRVIGEASNPQALPYRQDMTLLDLMIIVGGVTDFAAGNRAKILRVVDGQPQEFLVRIEDLLDDGDISANVDMLPGDILIIPEAWF